MVLLWSFQGRNVGAIRPGEAPSNAIHRWGGITLVMFDESGKIIAEIGEESTPGPFARLADET